MTRQTINTGTGANSNNGDPLRTAFTKINSNFEELYTLIGSGTGNVVDVVGPLFDHTDHNNVTVTLDSVNDRIVLDAQLSSVIKDIKGSVFADDSTLLVDAIDGKHYGEFVGNLKGTVVADDSTIIVDGVGSYVNLDGTVKGNIIPDTDIAYDIGSPTNRFKDIYLSGNTMYLGSAVLQATQSGGLSLPQGSSIPGLTDVKFKPEFVIDDRQGQQYYATGAPASVTVIDQATWLWSDPAKRYPTFQPSVYAATIDGSGNITGLSLDTANYYTDTSEQWEIINTDNLIALDAGIDITDPAAIRASSYFEVLPAVVQSVGDTVLASGAAPAVSGSIDVTDISVNDTLKLGPLSSGNPSVYTSVNSTNATAIDLNIDAGTSGGVTGNVTISGDTITNSFTNGWEVNGSNGASIVLNDDGVTSSELGLTVDVVDFGTGTTIDMQGNSVLFGSATIQDFAPGNVYANSGQFLYVTGKHAGGTATNVAFTYDTNINNPRQTFYGKTEFGFNGQTPIVDFDGATINNWSDPNVVNEHGSSAVITIGIQTASMDNLTVRIVENSPGDIDVEFNYDAGATASVSANGDLANRFSGTTTFAAGNTTWTTMNILNTVGDKGEFTIVDHSYHKIYRVTTFAKALPAPGTAGDAYCIIERLK